MDQSTHNVRRGNWLNIINECQNRPATVSVKKWLAENGVKEKAYYYWLRKFRKEAYEQMQVPAVSKACSEVAFAEIKCPEDSNFLPFVSATERPAITIRHKALSIEISNDISEELLSRIIREVSHA